MWRIIIFRTKPKEMLPTPRAPRPVSLADLLQLGYLTESDILPGGHVEESCRARAERAYAEHRTRSRPRRPTTTPARAPPLVPRSPAVRSSHVSAAQVHRVQVRRAVSGSDAMPKRLVLDACCVCMSTPRDHAVVPCFHMCVCAACAMRIVRCPMCRGDLKRVERIYF